MAVSAPAVDREEQLRLLPDKLRCFAYPTSRGVVARCLEVNLSVERPTLEEASTELHAQLESYTESAVQHGWVRKLFPRRSSWRMYVLYVVLRLLVAVVMSLHSFSRILGRYSEARVWKEQPGAFAT